MSSFLLSVAFLSGILTILAPCVLPLLPVIIGGTASSHNKWRPVIVVGSLSASIIVFTLLLKASSFLIDLPQSFWTSVSGGIVLVFGIFMLFPHIWEVISVKFNFGGATQSKLQQAGQKESVWGGILIGAALGPVFSSCSPTYFLIIATILPVSFFYGFIYLIVYSLGLALMLGLIAFFGQKLIGRLGWAANSNGLFKRGLGILLIAVGLLVLTGYEKKLESAILDLGYGVTDIEERLLENMNNEIPMKNIEQQTSLPFLYDAPELRGLTNWINHDPIESMKDLKGKVVLIDFWTYSCINCIRTLPHIQGWHEKYENDGLVILGIHAPEFQFEKDPKNVQKAALEYGLTYPIMQDNDFKLWRAYDNRYWPAKYLIDKQGKVRYTHFGEGSYDKTEKAITELLGAKLEAGEVKAQSVNYKKILTPEIYVGLSRRDHYINHDPEDLNEWTLTGEWNEKGEQATNISESSTIKLIFQASTANLVMDGDGKARVLIDGELANPDNSGVDVKNGIITINEARLYELTDFGDDYKTHSIEIEFLDSGISLFAWTFG